MLKRLYIKEEFVALTGDYRGAVLLNYLEGCYENGWVQKSHEELGEESMILSSNTAREPMDRLVDAGWVLKKNLSQYRFNPTKVAEDLREIGYELQGWRLS